MIPVLELDEWQRARRWRLWRRSLAASLLTILIAVGLSSGCGPAPADALPPQSEFEFGLDPPSVLRILLPEACIRAGQRQFHLDRAAEIPALLRRLLDGDSAEFEGPIGLCVVALDTSPRAEIADLVVPVAVLTAVRRWDAPRLVHLAHDAVHQLWLGDCTTPMAISPTLSVVLARPGAGGACAE